MYAFDTPRLVVQDWRPDLTVPEKRKALETALPSLLSAAVLEHLPPSLGLATCDGDIGRWIDARVAESTCLTVRERVSQDLVGLVILAEDRTGRPPTIHLGYLLAQSTWGRGLGSELVAGLVGSFGEGARSRLIGGVGVDNPASARVLRKAGFEKDARMSDEETEIYLLETGRQTIDGP